MKFRKKPIVIEAFKWTGDIDQEEDPEWIIEKIKNGSVKIVEGAVNTYLDIKTLEGIMTAIPGDYIIKGVQGEIYPCKSDIFKETYDEVKEE